MDEKNLKSERALIGRRLRRARLSSGATIEEAAKAAGVQPLAIERWEKGQALPCLVRFRELMMLYGVISSDILWDSNPYRMSQEETAELLALSCRCSPQLRARIELLASTLGCRAPVGSPGANAWSAE